VIGTEAVAPARALSQKTPLARALQRAAAPLLLVAMLYFVTPPAAPRFGLCGFHWLTGRPCPLCGLTRALFALAKGNWSEAIHLNALAPVGFAMLMSLFSNGSVRSRIWMAGAALFSVFGICRILFNLP